MRRIVFYSWQSDLPNPTNRGFIQGALEETTAKIAADNTVAVEPVVDRDTKNIPGSPDIASTIFSKITGSDIFVADVSIVTRAEGMRSTPNPNVLIELGYALKTLGHERIILVFNKSFGKIEELPFDLRTRRILLYEMPENIKERALERKRLEGQLEEAIRVALVAVPEVEPITRSIPAVNAIENAEPNRRIVLRRNLDELLKKFDDTEPKKHRDGGTADELIAGIEKTQEIVAEFSKIAETIAVINDFDSAIDLYRWFGKIFDRYTLPDDYNGRHSNADQDFFKFIGHEMFVTFIAFLMREQRWDTLAKILEETISTRIPNRGNENVDWEYASEHLSLLLDESTKRRRMSLHGDLLKQRHTPGGGLAAILPLQDFMDADFFMFLLSRTVKDGTGFDLRYWRAWSCLSLRNVPTFIRNSERTRFAEGIAKALNINSVADFKKLLAERGPELANLFRNSGGFWDYPIRQADIDKIGTR